jgi:lipoate-protein ligase A
VAAPQWRVWTYEQPALVLGCSQRALRPAIELQLQGRLSVVEREAGGGAVLAGPWLLGLSLVLPAGHAWLDGGLLPSYRRLGELHVEALQSLGVTARVVPPDEVPSRQPHREPERLDWACFGGLSPWEVVAAQGRKLVGMAQRRRQTGVLLVAGTLVTEPDWELLCNALGRPDDAALLRQRTVTCEQLLGRPLQRDALAEVLARRLETLR